MKINTVTVSSGWILQKISERIHSELQKLCEATISHEPNLLADVNFYVDVQNCYHHKTNTIDIGYFTHLDQNSVRAINTNWFSLDHIFHHGQRYYDVFKNWYPEDKMSIVLPGEIPKGFALKKPCLGVFQRGSFEGKGEYFMQALSENPISSNFSFLFVGSGWDAVISQFNNKGISVENITNEDYAAYSDLYNKIDYLLIPSLWEGGPMAVIEAYAKGIPIISSNVGWVGTNFVVDHMYEPNNLSQLTTILEDIIYPIKKRRKQVEHLSYVHYAKKLVQVAEELCDET
jgi:glycosyltransferase involved in cell wall biosynthesis